MKEACDLTANQRKQAEETLHGLSFAQLMGMRLVDLRLNEAVIKIEMRDDLRQPHGVLHGGVTAALIDTAMAFAIMTQLAPDEKATTVDLTVHYLRPHFEGTFICTAKVVRAGKRIITVSADVVNAEGKQIATAISTYTKL